MDFENILYEVEDSILIGQRHFGIVFCRKPRHGTVYCKWRCRQVTHDLILLTSIPAALNVLVFVFV